MRYHDIERLKEAARRYAANKYTVGDMEELSEFACNALFEPPCSEKIRKVDNGESVASVYDQLVIESVHPAFRQTSGELWILSQARYRDDLTFLAATYFEQERQAQLQRERRGDA